MITDNQNEIFDVVDEDDRVIGKVRRGEANRNKNLIHRSIGVAVFNSKGEMFLQQRSATKDTDPGKWTISCSGHLEAEFAEVGHDFFPHLPNSSRQAGLKTVGVLKKHASPQTLNGSYHPLDVIYEVTAKRELQEELGIENLELELVEKYICRAPNETEMVMLFKAKSDGPFKLHPQEITQGKFFTQKELKELVDKGKIKLSFMGKVALEKLGWV